MSWLSRAAEKSGLTDQVIPVNNDMDRHRAASGALQKTDQPIQIVIVVKFYLHPALSALALDLDTGSEILRQFIGQTAQIDVKGFGRRTLGLRVSDS